jgi:hypothetical protein
MGTRCMAGGPATLGGVWIEPCGENASHRIEVFDLCDRHLSEVFVACSARGADNTTVSVTDFFGLLL